MAQPQVIPTRAPATVIQGTRREIEAQLQHVDEEETLTLIIPGKELKTNGTGTPTAQKPHAGMTFREIFASSQEGFDQTGMTDEELDEFIDQQVREARAELDSTENQA